MNISRKDLMERTVDMRPPKCGGGPDIPQFPYWADATDADVADYLASRTEGKSADFCQSLAQQFRTKGEWSPKQRHHARKMYREGWEDEAAWLSHKNRHDWEHVSTTNHGGDDRLGTFALTQHYRCWKCGESGEVYREKNWSGD